MEQVTVINWKWEPIEILLSLCGYAHIEEIFQLLLAILLVYITVISYIIYYDSL
jgi:hypothetical protein